MTSAINAAATRVERVIFTDELPDYPVSSETGIAYVINIAGKSRAEREKIETGVRSSKDFRRYF
jgi:hypothetical protein